MTQYIPFPAHVSDSELRMGGDKKKQKTEERKLCIFSRLCEMLQFRRHVKAK